MQDNLINRYNLDNFEAAFRNFLIIQRVSPATLKNYLSDFRHFCGWLSLHISSNHTEYLNTVNQNTIFSFFSISLIEQYKLHLITNNLPDKTVNRRLSTVRKFCSFAIDQGWIKENPAKKVTNILVNQPNTPLSSSFTPIQTFIHQVPTEKKQTPIETQLSGHDFIKQFKEDMSSQQTNQKDADQILNDVNEFFTFINS